MNILHLHPGPDTGGQSMAGKRVLEAAGHSVRVMVRSHHDFGYEQAEKWSDLTLDTVREAYAWADTVILHNNPAELFAKVDDGSRKRLVVHHHGTRFRQHPRGRWREAEEIGAVQVFSTIDLVVQAGGGEWFGQVVDIEAMEAIRDEHYVERRHPTVVHCPTNALVKGTRMFKMAGRQMRYQATFDIVRRKTWAECLRRKAKADVFFDQMYLGYGNNALEAWAMGIPVLSGVSNEGSILPVPAHAVLERMRYEFGGSLPFFQTSNRTIISDIRAFIGDRDLRAEWGRIGAAHVRRLHSPEGWLARTERIYSGDVAEVAA